MSRKVTLKSLAEATSEKYRVGYRELVGKTMQPLIIMPRHVFFFVAHNKAGHSLSDIGRFTDKCHTTVLYATRKMKHRVTRSDSDDIIKRAQELDAHKRKKYLELAKEVGK
tara:strand:- start:197 stop:529 length:333 start_codon:yes stop_codon:yes gene_type:complete